MMYFPANYNPYGPHSAPQPPAPDPLPLAVFEAAQRAGASHLSADGQRIYTVRYGEILQAKWQKWPGEFGAWEVVVGAEDFPADAVRM